MPLAVVCTVIALVLSLLMAFRHGGSLLFVWLVEGCLAQFPAGPWLHLSFLKLGLSAELGLSPNLQRGETLIISVSKKIHYKTIQTWERPEIFKYCKGESIHRHREYSKCNTHRLSADRMVNRRLLLLLQFSSANFFPVVVLTLLLSSGLSGTFGLPKTLEGSVGFLLPVEASVTGTAAWKKLCLAVCVLWAEAIQDREGGVGLIGFRTIFNGADSTEEEGRDAGWVWLTLFNRPAELAGPFLIPASEEEDLQLFWWALQIKVSGFFPGL